MATEAQIIAKGKSDYFHNGGVYRNPYPLASNEFNHYERGWMQSLKVDGGKLVKGSSAPVSEPRISTTFNRYAELKGRDRPR